MYKNKLSMLLTLIGSVAILIVGAIMFNQISKQHHANQLIIGKCFETFNKQVKVFVKKDGFGSPVTCEVIDL